MSYAGLQMLMDNLKKLIHGNHDPLINNDPMILSEMPQFQLLYQELASIIQILSNIHQHHHHQHHELEKVRNLKKRFKDATEEAQDIIDLFLSGLHFRRNRELPLDMISLLKSPNFYPVYRTSLELENVMRSIESIKMEFMTLNIDNMKMDSSPTLKTHSPGGTTTSDISKTSLFLSCLPFRNRELSPRSVVFKTSLDLKNVMRSIKSIKAKFKTININKMKMDSSSSTCGVADTSTSRTGSRLGTRKPLEEIVVGLDHDAEIIRDKLTQDTKQLSVVSIAGMGGLGKTTLATKVFNDSFIVYHFHIRAWVTVSQTYKKRDFLIQILKSIDVQQGLDEASDSQLREKLHKKLIGIRYLIVIDDIWSIEAWEELKLFFPHDNTASRILLTTRLNEVALHMKPHGFVHFLPCLTEEESWELLKQKVFHGDDCPEWSIKPGMQIAKKCHGLPLSVVVMAGVLTEEAMNKDLWENIACSVSSYIVSDQKGSLETLALSYHHLPDHLRECFLYLGGFPEDSLLGVERLIWLWVAEGFIEEAENRSLEDTARAYLMDLINRNLVTVAKRNSIGDVKACKVHDLVRELCLQKAKEERFFLKIDLMPPRLCPDILYQQRRIFINEYPAIVSFTSSPTPTIRSFLCLETKIPLFPIILFADEDTAHCFVLLRVLDLQKCQNLYFPEDLALLVHLRYLAIRYFMEFPNSICKLWSLQTLVLQASIFDNIQLPGNITDLVNLRHLWSNGTLHLPYIGKPMNLQSISKVVLKDGIDNFHKCFPNIKKLALLCDKDGKYHFELLPYLESLKLMGRVLRQNHLWLPATLKKLTLKSCGLPWSDMSIIQSLPNLVVLKLKIDAFVGTQWDASEQQFRQLKLLTLEDLGLKQWEASSTSFPCLKQLSLLYCYNLEEIPLEIGEIATLELIEIGECSLVDSAKRIQQEQHDVGNNDLKITIDGMDVSYHLSQLESLESE